jgi:RNA polymerase sigma-70 factor, ECF subfamily
MSSSNLDEPFVDRITSAQQSLFAHILVLLPDVTNASDVLQETNLILWRKREEFRPDQDFLCWAKAIAHYQVLASLKRQRRSRLRFGDTLLSQLAEEAVVPEGPDVEGESVILGQCISELAQSSQELLQLRYSSDLALSEVARRIGRSVDSVRCTLHRIRRELADCIKRRLGATGLGQ